MAVELHPQQARRLRLAGQSLRAPLADGPRAAVQVARRLCGLQAQDLFAAMLGVRVRSSGTRADDVDQARTKTRSVLWTWAMRGTLHLLATEDADWLLPLLGPVLIAADRRRRQQLGLDEDVYQRGLHAVRGRLTADGPATREELAASLAAAGLPTGYSVERHLLYRAALEGTICMGPDRGSRPTFVLLDEWLGRRLEPVPQAEALARLAERYLTACSPATPADMVAWSGLPAKLVRAGWQAVAGQLTEVTVMGQQAWVPARRLDALDEPPAPSPSVRLLPAFDAYLLSHCSRDLIVDGEFARRVNAGGGMIKPVLLVDGQVAGTWRSNRKGRRVDISAKPFATPSPEVEAGVAAEIADIERFLGTAPTIQEGTDEH